VKQPVMSFLVKNTKPRNIVAKAMFDRNGPYTERTEPKRTDWKRKPKNRREAFAEWE
jgi:hypothetical protein